MREIKFRAFSKEYEKMIYQDYDDWDFALSLSDEWITLYSETMVDSNPWCTWHEQKYEWLEDKSAIIMQYTWLKDKHWKEIYEWDLIIDNNQQHSWYNKIIEVEITPYKTTTKQESLWYWAWEWYEVIWNIYENPDLLTNK